MNETLGVVHVLFPLEGCLVPSLLNKETMTNIITIETQEERVSMSFYENLPVHSFGIMSPECSLYTARLGCV